MKNAVITRVHRKGAKTSKDNYRPVIILPNISKIYDIFLNEYQNILNLYYQNFNAVLKKGFSAQHCLLAMLENWKFPVDNKRNFGPLLTDLSKAFECLSHDLLQANLNAYGFDLPAVRQVQSFLSNRKQKTKINSELSSWEEILFRVAQGSVLGPFLSDIFLCDLFFIMNDVEFASYSE